MRKRKTTMTTAQLEKKWEKQEVCRNPMYLKTLKDLTDMEVWQEFQRVSIPDELVSTKEGLWQLERCREEMTDRIHFADLRDVETEDI